MKMGRRRGESSEIELLLDQESVGEYDPGAVAAGFQWLRRLIPQCEIVSWYLSEVDTPSTNILASAGGTGAPTCETFVCPKAARSSLTPKY